MIISVENITVEDVNQLSYEALDYYGAACQKKINKYWVLFSFMSSHGIRSNHLNDYGFCYFNLSKCFFSLETIVSKAL